MLRRKGGDIQTGFVKDDLINLSYQNRVVCFQRNNSTIFNKPIVWTSFISWVKSKWMQRDTPDGLVRQPDNKMIMAIITIQLNFSWWKQHYFCFLSCLPPFLWLNKPNKYRHLFISYIPFHYLIYILNKYYSIFLKRRQPKVRKGLFGKWFYK